MTTTKRDLSEHVGVALLCVACAVLFIVLLMLGGVVSCGEDPDPCDPDCPPVTENPSGD